MPRRRQGRRNARPRTRGGWGGGTPLFAVARGLLSPPFPRANQLNLLGKTAVHLGVVVVLLPGRTLCSKQPLVYHKLLWFGCLYKCRPC
jgi:hypothetical protein